MSQIWKNLHALIFIVVVLVAGLSLEGDLGEKVSLIWLTSPYFELREKLKCTKYLGM